MLLWGQIRLNTTYFFVKPRKKFVGRPSSDFVMFLTSESNIFKTYFWKENYLVISVAEILVPKKLDQMYFGILNLYEHKYSFPVKNTE